MISGPQQFIESAFSLARKQRDPEIHRFTQICRQVRQHREAPAHVESADANRDAGCAQRTGDVHGARKLISLDTHQTDERAAPTCANLTNHPVGANPRVRFIPGGDHDLDGIAERTPIGAVPGQPVHRRQRIGRNGRARPLDNVAVVIVVRRLDEKELE